jgi:hypothetical protein
MNYWCSQENPTVFAWPSQGEGRPLIPVLLGASSGVSKNLAAHTAVDN